MGEILYPYEKIESDASSKHNLADISELLYSYVATKHYFVKGVGAVTSCSVKMCVLDADVGETLIGQDSDCLTACLRRLPKCCQSVLIDMAC